MKRITSYKITDAEGNEHWVPQSRGVRWTFGKVFVLGTIWLVIISVAVTSLLPTTQSGGVVDTGYTVRTLAPSSTVTTTPVTTKASGAAAIACQALGFK